MFYYTRALHVHLILKIFAFFSQRMLGSNSPMNKSSMLHGLQVKGIQDKQTLKRNKRRFNLWDNTLVKKLNIELIRTCSWGKKKPIHDMSKNKVKQTQTRVEKSSWRRVKIRMLHSPTSHHPLAMPLPTQGGYWQTATVTCLGLESHPEGKKHTQ